MKKQYIILPVALLGLGLAACNKQEPAAGGGANPAAQPPQVTLETKLTNAYGFAAKVPSNVEGYCSFYGLGKLWADIKQDKAVAEIRTNPLVTRVTDDPAFKQQIATFSQNPDAAKARAIASDALGQETFIEFSPGSSAILASWIRFNDDMRIANIKNALDAKSTGTPPANPYNLKAMLPFLKTLELPPLVVGFKMNAQKAELNADIDKAEKNLPPGVDLTAFNLNGDLPFKSLVVVVGKVLPAPYQGMLKNMVSQSITDPTEADATYQALLTRRLEIAYGYVGDYFIVSIGTDHAHLKLAANFGESVLSRPEVAVAANYADKPLLSFCWSSPELMTGMQRKFQLSPYYEQLKPEIARSLAATDAEKLEVDLKRLDGEADAVFTQSFTPMVGITYRDHGLRGETFGGIKPTGNTASVKFSTVPPADTFLWVDSVSNPATVAAFRTWFEDASATSYDTFQHIGLPHLSNTQQLQFAMFQSMGLPKLTELYKISRDQFAKSLGSETAFALDLKGEIPALPMVPAPFHDGGRMFRLAYLSDVQDRALLGQSWDGYLKLARDISQMIPQAAMLPNGIPDATNEVVDGVTLSYYKPPLDTGDLLPNIATTDKTFVMSTSRSYSLALTKAAVMAVTPPTSNLQLGVTTATASAATPAKLLQLDFHMNFKPGFDFAVTWMALAAQYPNIFFSGDQAKAEQFKKLQPDLTSLLNALRPLQGVEGQVFEENGVRRMSSAIIWQK
ncbi:MAG: hypothetical protein WCD79_02790 [Chthoniobacteraceae bacterium]